MSYMHSLLYGPLKPLHKKIRVLSEGFIKACTSGRETGAITTIYLEALIHYRSAYADNKYPKEDEKIIRDFVHHLDTVFAKKQHRQSIAITGINQQQALENFPSFILYFLLTENRQFQKIFAEEILEHGDLFLHTVYHESFSILKEEKNIPQPLPLSVFIVLASWQVGDILPIVAA